MIVVYDVKNDVKLYFKHNKILGKRITKALTCNIFAHSAIIVVGYVFLYVVLLSAI